MKRVIAFLVIAAASVSAFCGNIADAFVSDSIPLFPTLEKNTRLDMMDYFIYKKDVEVANRMGGNSKLLACEEDYLKVRISDAMTTEMRMVAAKGDTIFIVVRNYSLPQADASVAVYNRSWKELPVADYIQLPTAADFINAPKKIKNELLQMIEFPLFSVSLEDKGQIVCENSILDRLSIEDAKVLKPYLIEKLVYKRTKDRYELAK